MDVSEAERPKAEIPKLCLPSLNLCLQLIGITWKITFGESFVLIRKQKILSCSLIL